MPFSLKKCPSRHACPIPSRERGTVHWRAARAGHREAVPADVPVKRSSPADWARKALHAYWVRRVHGGRQAARRVDTFHDDPGYIAALAAVVNDFWTRHGQPAHLVLSFHGLPRRSLARGDPYHCFCRMTGRLLARELGLEAHQWTLAFQSRFGRGRWLEPYTAATLAKLGGARPRRVDVFAPGFVSDCLETLEELAIEGKRTYQAAGGGDYEVIPCLNEHARWIAALADIVLANLQGWLSPPPSGQAREATMLRAKVLGASA